MPTTSDSRPPSGSDEGPLKIAVTACPQYAHGRNVIRGVNEYIEKDPTITANFHIALDTLIDLYHKYDGIISSFSDPVLEQIPIHIPHIRIGESYENGPINHLKFDNNFFGALAAKALYDFGVATYAYYPGIYGDNQVNRQNNIERLSGFQSWINKNDSNRFDKKHYVCKIGDDRAIGEWLLQLRKPAGILAYNDLGAVHLSQICAHYSISVPDEIALIGVDNDPLLCELNEPHLSSIDTDVKQISFNAAQSLAQQIRRHPAKQLDLPAAEPYAVLRASTGHRNCGDPYVLEALHLMDQLKFEKFKLSELARRVGLGLRSLEILFKDHLNTTIQNELSRLQINEIKRLLRTTDLSIEAIAHQSGWEVSSLHHAFKRETHRTPNAYKKLFSGPTSNPQKPSKKKQIPVKKEKISIGAVLAMTGKVHHDLLKGIEVYCKKNHNVRFSLRIDATRHTALTKQYDFTREKIFTDCDGFIISTDFKSTQSIPDNTPFILIDHEREQVTGKTVTTDNHGLGQLAARYFLGKGYTQFAYCDYLPQLTSRSDGVIDKRSAARYAAFRETLIDKHVPAEQVRHLPYQNSKTLASLLKSLPQSTALLAFNDYLASFITLACYNSGIRIPDDIAILGIDNDEFVCGLSSPAISSIDINFTRAGYLIAKRLHEWILNGTAPEAEDIIETRHLVERGSTKALGTQDPVVLSVVQFIKEHLDQNVTIDDITAPLGLTRRSVEMRFKKAMHHTILEELNATRIHAAADLITSTSLSIKEVADACGFNSSTRFSQVFKSQMQTSPAAYRKKRSALI